MDRILLCPFCLFWYFFLNFLTFICQIRCILLWFFQSNCLLCQFHLIIIIRLLLVLKILTIINYISSNKKIRQNDILKNPLKFKIYFFSFAKLFISIPLIHFYTFLRELLKKNTIYIYINKYNITKKNIYIYIYILPKKLYTVKMLKELIYNLMSLICLF